MHPILQFLLVTKFIAAKRPARPRKSKSIKDLQDPSPANKAVAQLLREARLSLTLQQICDLISSFRAEVRRILVKPRKIKDSSKTEDENMYLSNTNGEDNGNCPRILVKVNNLYYVNALLDRGAVPNIVSLDLIKKLGIKELLKILENIPWKIIKGANLWILFKVGSVGT